MTTYNLYKFLKLHFKLGNALLRAFSQDKKKEGLWHLEKAIRLKPDFAEAIEHLSIEIMEENPARGSRLAQNAASFYIRPRAILKEPMGY